MKKLNSCARYKIGFFALLILIMLGFGLFVSSSFTKFSYKNRASETGMAPALPPVEEATPVAQEKRFMIATISAFQKGADADTYNVTMEEVIFKTFDEEKKADKNKSMMLFTRPEDLNKADEVIPAKVLTCSFTGKTISQLVELATGNQQQTTDGTVTSPETVITEKLIPIDEAFLKDGFLNHSYMVDYEFDTDVTPNPGHQKLCTITGLRMQVDVKPSPTPTPTIKK